MYNADGSMKAINKHKYPGGNNGNSVHDTNFGNGFSSDSKENQRSHRGGKQFQDDGVPAAGMKSQVTDKVGHRSRATNEEAQLRNVAGSNIFSEADALQTREVNQRKLQDIRGHDIFSDNPTRPAAGGVPGLSDAKKKALYSTSVFNQDDPAAAPQVSDLKKNEMSGSIVFGSSSDEQPRSGIGGVRKPPGGGSSLTFGESSPQTNNSGRRTPGGQSSFSFGW